MMTHCHDTIRVGFNHKPVETIFSDTMVLFVLYIIKPEFSGGDITLFQDSKRFYSAPYNARKCQSDWRRTYVWLRPPRPHTHAHLNSKLFDPCHLSGPYLETSRLKIAPVHQVVFRIVLICGLISDLCLVMMDDDEHVVCIKAPVQTFHAAPGCSQWRGRLSPF